MNPFNFLEFHRQNKDYGGELDRIRIASPNGRTGAPKCSYLTRHNDRTFCKMQKAIGKTKPGIGFDHLEFLDAKPGAGFCQRALKLHLIKIIVKQAYFF